MKRLSWMLGFALLCGVILSHPLNGQDPAEGRWKRISLEVNGAAKPPTIPGTTSARFLVFPNDNWWPFNLHMENRDPKEIDMASYIANFLFSKPIYCIYGLENERLHVLVIEDFWDRAKEFDTAKKGYSYSIFERDDGEPLDPDAEKLIGEWTFQQAQNAVLPDMHRVTLNRVEYRNQLEGTIYGRPTRYHPEGRKIASLLLVTVESAVVPTRIKGRINKHDDSPPPSDRLRRRRAAGQRVAGDKFTVESLNLDGHYNIRDGMFYIQFQFAAHPWGVQIRSNAPVWEFVLKKK